MMICASYTSSIPNPLILCGKNSATPHIAKRLVEKPLSLTLHSKYPQTVELVQAVKDIHGEKNDPVSVKELRRKFNKPKKTILRWLEPALENGWIENVGEEGKGKPFKLAPGKFDGDDTETNLLPSVETLLERFPEDAQNFNLVDPITGKEIRSEKA